MKCGKCGAAQPKKTEDLAVFETLGNNGGMENTSLIGIIRVSLCSCCIEKLCKESIEPQKEQTSGYIALIAVIFAIVVFVLRHAAIYIPFTVALFGLLTIGSMVYSLRKLKAKREQRCKQLIAAKANGFTTCSLCDLIDDFDHVSIHTILNMRKLNSIRHNDPVDLSLIDTEELRMPLLRKKDVYVNRRLGTVKPTSSYTYTALSDLAETHLRLTGKALSPSILPIYQQLTKG